MQNLNFFVFFVIEILVELWTIMLLLFKCLFNEPTIVITIPAGHSGIGLKLELINVSQLFLNFISVVK